MIQTMMDSAAPSSRGGSYSGLLLPGFPLILATAGLACRIVWEETWLSLEQGPQMIGFSLAHGPLVFLFLAPLLLALWLIAAFFITSRALWRRRRLSAVFWLTCSVAILVEGLVALPQQFWQCVLISRFASSPNAAEFMTEDAAEGYVRTVAAYLDHGISVDARGRYGTAADAAAVGGSVEVLKLLHSRDADLNAIDFSGHSPLANAIEMKRTAAISYLRSQGALEIKPPPPPEIPADVTVTH